MYTVFHDGHVICPRSCHADWDFCLSLGQIFQWPSRKMWCLGHRAFPYIHFRHSEICDDQHILESWEERKSLVVRSVLYSGRSKFSYRKSVQVDDFSRNQLKKTCLCDTPPKQTNKQTKTHGRHHFALDWCLWISWFKGGPGASILCLYVSILRLYGEPMPRYRWRCVPESLGRKWQGVWNSLCLVLTP